MVLAVDVYSILIRVSAFLGVIAAIIISLGIIHTKVVGPWVAKPIANAVRNELVEAVEAIILSDLIQNNLKEVVEEYVSHEMRQVLSLLHEHSERLERIENGTGYLVSKSTDKK